MSKRTKAKLNRKRNQQLAAALAGKGLIIIH